jgi:hypothetical protein
MAATHEAHVKKRVRALLTQYEVYWRQSTTGGYGHSGQLDFYCCHLGRYIGIETKSVHTKHGVTALQQREIDEILDAGGIALVINETNYQELEDALHAKPT